MSGTGHEAGVPDYDSADPVFSNRVFHEALRHLSVSCTVLRTVPDPLHDVRVPVLLRRQLTKEWRELDLRSSGHDGKR